MPAGQRISFLGRLLSVSGPIGDLFLFFLSRALPAEPPATYDDRPGNSLFSCVV